MVSIFRLVASDIYFCFHGYPPHTHRGILVLLDFICIYFYTKIITFLINKNNNHFIDYHFIIIFLFIYLQKVNFLFNIDQKESNKD